VNAKEERPHIQSKNDESGDKRSQEPFPVSVRRLWLFRVIALVVTPILLLVMLEIGLRVIGYGFPATTFIREQANGKTLYCSNSKFGWWFFPREISRQFEPFVVPAEKSDNTYRIFVLGESAAQGDPEPSYGFSRQLAVMLRYQYPSVNFEVFNASMTAINSHAILKIAGDCARLKPDLFVIYMGNNEVVGPYGAGTVFSPLSKSLFLIRASISLKATKTGQLMGRLADISSRTKTTPETWGGLEMFLGKQIRRDDQRMRYVYSHFRSNLEDIVGIAQKSGAKVLLSTVAVNLKDCPPFASLNRDVLNEQQKKSFDELYQSGIELEKAGDFNSAIEKYQDCAKIDDTYAELEFRFGRCLWNLGRFDKAWQRYAFAKELDTLRFRADSEINRIIAETGRNNAGKGVYFIDAAGAFEANSPHNCPGFELFLEHVHPVFAGNYLLAKTVFEQVEQILPERFKAMKASTAAPDVNAALASEQLVAGRLAFTVYDNLRVTKLNLQNISQKQPYISQAYNGEMVNFWKQKVEQFAAATGPAARAESLKQYQLAISHNGADRDLRVNYARLLMEDKSNFVAAYEQYRRIVELVPNDHHTLVDLATLEAGAGKLDLALKHVLSAVRYMPTDSTANYTAGAVYQMMGQYENAQSYLAESVRLNPKLALGYSNLAAVLGMQGQIDQAEDTLRKGIEMLPDNARLRFALAGLLRQKGLLEESESQRLKAIELDPNLASVGK
jgi:tetratricopeptide (TPR) repeat protein